MIGCPLDLDFCTHVGPQTRLAVFRRRPWRHELGEVNQTLLGRSLDGLPIGSFVRASGFAVNYRCRALMSAGETRSSEAPLSMGVCRRLFDRTTWHGRAGWISLFVELSEILASVQPTAGKSQALRAFSSESWASHYYVAKLV